MANAPIKPEPTLAALELVQEKILASMLTLPGKDRTSDVHILRDVVELFWIAIPDPDIRAKVSNDSDAFANWLQEERTAFFAGANLENCFCCTMSNGERHYVCFLAPLIEPYEVGDYLAFHENDVELNGNLVFRNPIGFYIFQALAFAHYLKHDRPNLASELADLVCDPRLVDLVALAVIQITAEAKKWAYLKQRSELQSPDVHFESSTECADCLGTERVPLIDTVATRKARTFLAAHESPPDKFNPEPLQGTLSDLSMALPTLGKPRPERVWQFQDEGQICVKKLSGHRWEMYVLRSLYKSYKDRYDIYIANITQSK